MCDYSLQNAASRPAKVGDKLTVHDFGTGTRGFASPENLRVAVCILPGTELAFTKGLAIPDVGLFGLWNKTIRYKTARFRQINKDQALMHHDALEFPDGRMVLLSHLWESQEATVLQLPAQPTTATEIEEQRRVEYVG